jgi:choline dehydrogenase
VRKNFSNSTLKFLSTYPADWPEVEYLALENTPVDLIPVTPYDNFIGLSAVLLAHESKGNMTISSADILDPPIINPNWLTTKADIEQAHAAFLRLREIISHWDTVASEIFPGPTVSTETDILEFMKEHGALIFHGTSTCKWFSKQIRYKNSLLWI